eukprot:1226174-Rhodomonas_salina.1
MVGSPVMTVRAEKSTRFPIRFPRTCPRVCTPSPPVCTLRTAPCARTPCACACACALLACRSPAPPRGQLHTAFPASLPPLPCLPASLSPLPPYLPPSPLPRGQSLGGFRGRAHPTLLALDALAEALDGLAVAMLRLRLPCDLVVVPARDPRPTSAVCARDPRAHVSCRAARDPCKGRGCARYCTCTCKVSGLARVAFKGRGCS